MNYRHLQTTWNGLYLSRAQGNAQNALKYRMVYDILMREWDWYYNRPSNIITG